MKKKQKIFSAKNRVPQLFAILISFLLISGSYLYYKIEENALKKDKHEELKSIAELKINQITQWLIERKGDANVLTNSPFFKDAIQKYFSDNKNKELQDNLKQKLHTLKLNYGYNSLYLFSNKGDLLLSTEKDTVLIDSLTKRKVEEAFERKNLELSGFYKCPTHKKIHLDFIAPIFNENNYTVAAVLLRINPEDFLYPLIQSWPVPSKTAETLLVSNDNDSVLFLNELRFQKNTALRLKIPLSAANVPAVRAVKGDSGVFEGADYRGHEVLSYLRQVPGTDWFMVAKVDKDEIYSELYFRAIFTGSLTFILIVLVGSGFVIRYKNGQKHTLQQLLNKEIELRKSLEENKTVLYSIGDAVITTDTRGIITRMNTVAENLTGWSESDGKGVPIEKVFVILNEETKAEVENPVTRVLQNGMIVGLANHTILIAKDGREIPIADSGAPIKGETGEVTGVVLVFRDQTEERSAKKAILESEANFRNLFEHSAAGISMTGIDGSLHVNNAFCSMLGFSEVELKNKSWMEITHADDIEESKKIIQEMIVGRKSSVRMEKRYIHKDGNIVWTDVSTFIQRDSNGNPKYFITNLVDITKRRLAEETLRKSEELYRSLFESMLNGFAYCKIILENGRPVDFVFLVVNESFQKQTGLKDVTGKKVSEVIPDILESDSKLIEIYVKVALEGKPEAFEIYVEAMKMWFSVSAYCPEKEYFVTVFDEITGRKQAEDELRASEDKFSSIFNHAPIAMSLATIPGGVIYDVNAEWLKLNGFLKKEEVIGKTTVQLGLINDLETRNQIIDEFQRNGSVHNVEISIINRMGEQHIILVDVLIVEIGGRQFMLSTNMDITERKQAIEIIRKNARELEIRNSINNVFLTVPGENMYTNVLGIILSFMRSKFGVFGYIDEHGNLVVPTMTRTVWNKYQVPDKRITFLKETWSNSSWPTAIREKRTIFDNKPSSNIPDGHIAITRHISLPLIHNNEVIGLIQVANKETDYTTEDIDLLETVGKNIAPVLDARLNREREELKRKQAEEELIHLNENLENRVLERTNQLEVTNKELEAFSYSVSHDLRAPLRHVSGYIDLLEKRYYDTLPEKAKHYLFSIADSIKEMGTLIDDLLQFSRTSRQEMHFTMFSMSEAVKEIVDTLKRENPMRNIKWLVNDLPEVLGDYNLIKLVWYNLLSNAVKYSKLQKIAIIEIGYQLNNEELIFSVKDNGVGFDMQYAHKLFGVFQRLHSVGEYEGTGIGLANVRRIISRHNGRTWAEAQINKGATFYFTLKTKKEEQL